VNRQTLAGHGLKAIMDTARDIDLAGHAGMGNVARHPGSEPHFRHAADNGCVVFLT